ncbi:hypothetical protein F5Y19DRAFT_77660 [Xylariaceae sp. FL1651]|nr:hypothetical protein F5Y19DRAFT_77660 [Xylariaceae sp. FL1651]
MDIADSSGTTKRQAIGSSRGSKAVAPPPGMTEEARQERNKQYWKDKKLADQTRRNTKLNKGINRDKSGK